MAEAVAPEAVVRSAEEALGRDPHYTIRDVCDVLARNGCLGVLGEVPALRLKVGEQKAIIGAQERTEWELRDEIQRLRELLRTAARSTIEGPALFAALDAAPVADTTSDDGPDDGHTFEISARSRGSYAVVGEPHRDANWWGDPFVRQVRAWDLPAALRKAAALPLSAWAWPGRDEKDAADTTSDGT